MVVASASSSRALCFCISGQSSSKHRAELQNQGQQLGLAYQPARTSDVTHLVSDTVLSEKYAHAVSHRIPVVHPEWLRVSHTQGKLEPETRYLLPPCYGLRIALTGRGFTAEVRDRLTRMVRDMRSSCSGLAKSCHTGTCTRVCDMSETMGTGTATATVTVAATVTVTVNGSVTVTGTLQLKVTCDVSRRDRQGGGPGAVASNLPPVLCVNTILFYSVFELS